MHALRAATALPVLAACALMVPALFAGDTFAQEGGEPSNDRWIADWKADGQQRMNDAVHDFVEKAGKPVEWGNSPPPTPTNTAPVIAPPTDSGNPIAVPAPASPEPDASAAQDPGSNDIDTASQYGADSSTPGDSGDGSSWLDSYGATPGDAAAPASGDSWGSGGEDGAPASGGTGDDCHGACTVQ